MAHISHLGSTPPIIQNIFHQGGSQPNSTQPQQNIDLNSLKNEPCSQKRSRLLSLTTTKDPELFKLNLDLFINDPTENEKFFKTSSTKKIDAELNCIFSLRESSFLNQVHAAAELEDLKDDNILLFQKFISAILKPAPLGLPNNCYIKGDGNLSLRLNDLLTVYKNLKGTANDLQKNLFEYITTNLFYCKEKNEFSRKPDATFDVPYKSLLNKRAGSIITLLQTMYKNCNGPDSDNIHTQIIDMIFDNKISYRKGTTPFEIKIIPSGSKITLKEAKIELDPDSPFNQKLLEAFASHVPKTFPENIGSVNTDVLKKTGIGSLQSQLQEMAEEFTYVHEKIQNKLQEEGWSPAEKYKWEIATQATTFLNSIYTSIDQDNQDNVPTESNITEFINKALEVSLPKTPPSSLKHQEFIDYLDYSFSNEDDENPFKKALQGLASNKDKEALRTSATIQPLKTQDNKPTDDEFDNYT